MRRGLLFLVISLLPLAALPAPEASQSWQAWEEPESIDIIAWVVFYGVLPEIHRHEVAYHAGLEPASEAFAPLADFHQRFPDLSGDRLNHALLKSWYESLFSDEQTRVPYETFVAQPFSLISSIYFLSGLFNPDGETLLNAKPFSVLMDEALAELFLEQFTAYGELFDDYFGGMTFSVKSE